MAARKKVGVVMGGISPEHPVSLVSGTGMLKNLDPDRYQGFPILISKDNRWMWPREGADTSIASPEKAAEILAQPPADWHVVRFPEFSVFPRCDIMLLGLHGVGGEDGRLQGFLELAGQAYTGGGPIASALSMDKILAKQMYRAAGVPTARFRVLERFEFAGARPSLEKEFGYPVVVKDPMGGSSIGMGIAQDAAGLDSLLATLGASAGRLLVEEFLPGREGTCGYLEGYPLPPTEIRPLQDGFFNYEAKYQKGRTQELTPPEFPPAVIEEMKSLAERAHKALGLAVYSRTDMILTQKGLMVLETNNLPGFTPTSVLPQEAAHAGLSYRDLLTRIIEESFKK
jgi:D-alanine-D-alanine ligase